jgi:hypothetical protein
MAFALNLNRNTTNPYPLPSRPSHKAQLKRIYPHPQLNPLSHYPLPHPTSSNLPHHNLDPRTLSILHPHRKSLHPVHTLRQSVTRPSLRAKRPFRLSHAHPPRSDCAGVCESVIMATVSYHRRIEREKGGGEGGVDTVRLPLSHLIPHFRFNLLYFHRSVKVYTYIGLLTSSPPTTDSQIYLRLYSLIPLLPSNTSSPHLPSSLLTHSKPSPSSG